MGIGIPGILLLWPLAEIAGFVVIGPYLGIGGTLGFVIGSAFLGMALLRRAGIGTLLKLRAATERGETQVGPALDGGLRIIAALLIAVPGFLSGALGLVLLVPALRRLAVRLLGRRLAPMTAKPSPGVIDAEFTEIRIDPPNS